MSKKNDLLSNGWTQKTVRVRNDYIQVCSFLDYVKTQLSPENKYSFFDNLLNYSIDYITKNGFKYTIQDYDAMRKPKGFFMSKDTLEKVDISYKMYSSLLDLYVGEFYELLIYIYCKNNLPDQYKNMLGNIDWGITEVK